MYVFMCVYIYIYMLCLFFRELKSNNIPNLEFDSLLHLTELKKL